MEVLSSRRSDDAFLLISLDNDAKKLTIEESNDYAKFLLGTEFDTDKERDLLHYLSESTTSTFNEFFNFTDEFYNLFSVLNNLRNSKLRTKNGEDIDVLIKAFPCVGDDINKSYYQLLIRDIGTMHDINQFRCKFDNGEYLKKEFCSENSSTLNSTSTERELYFLNSFMKFNYVFSMPILIIDFFTQGHDNPQLPDIINQVCYKISNNIREEDEIGLFYDSSICCIFFDCSMQNMLEIADRIDSLISTTLNDQKDLNELEYHISYLSLMDINYEDNACLAIRNKVAENLRKNRGSSHIHNIQG